MRSRASWIETSLATSDVIAADAWFRSVFASFELSMTTVRGTENIDGGSALVAHMVEAARLESRRLRVASAQGKSTFSRASSGRIPERGTITTSLHRYVRKESVLGDSLARVTSPGRAPGAAILRLRRSARVAPRSSATRGSSRSADDWRRSAPQRSSNRTRSTDRSSRRWPRMHRSGQLESEPRCRVDMEGVQLPGERR